MGLLTANIINPQDANCLHSSPIVKTIVLGHLIMMHFYRKQERLCEYYKQQILKLSPIFFKDSILLVFVCYEIHDTLFDNPCTTTALCS